MYKSFVVRIYPDEVQENFFTNQFGCCRFVFNTFLDAKKKVYTENGEYLSFYDCSVMLTELKKSKTWLKRVDSTGLIESLKNLENAFNTKSASIHAIKINIIRYNLIKPIISITISVLMVNVFVFLKLVGSDFVPIKR